MAVMYFGQYTCQKGRIVRVVVILYFGQRIPSVGNIVSGTASVLL